MRTDHKLTVFTTGDGTQITTRSALEARWAIFFTELGLKWEYEPTSVQTKPMNETDKIAAEALARRFHETYERLAPAFNYDTRKESAKPWEQVPDTNKKLMIAVCAEILDTYVAAAIEKAEIAVRKDQMDLDDAMWSAKLADQSRAAHANEDNCRKCGRPLGWFEPGLCDNCRAARASNAKPLERCSSNPHYEAHFGDEPARTTEK